MTLNLNDRKYRLIERIMQMRTERQLALVEAYLSTIDEVEFQEKIAEASKPVPKDKTLEEIEKEQNAQPMNKKKFKAKIKALDIQEPIQELLATLD